MLNARVLPFCKSRRDIQRDVTQYPGAVNIALHGLVLAFSISVILFLVVLLLFIGIFK